MPKCQNCNIDFPNKIEIDGKIWNLTSRRFCPTCSPLGENNRKSYIITMELGKAFCVRCQKQKDRSEFHNRQGGKKPLSYCRSCSEEVKILKFNDKLEKAIALKGGICADCGNTFPTPVFEFRADDKVFPLSLIKNMSWERLQEILATHDMLCHNCGSLRDWAKGD